MNLKNKIKDAVFSELPKEWSMRAYRIESSIEDVFDEYKNIKQTIQSLSEHIGKSRQSLYHMKKASPKQFEILLLGWETYCKQKIKDLE